MFEGVWVYIMVCGGIYIHTIPIYLHIKAYTPTQKTKLSTEGEANVGDWK